MTPLPVNSNLKVIRQFFFISDLIWPQNYFTHEGLLYFEKKTWWFSQNLLAISCEKLSGILKIEFRFFSLSIFGALFLPMMSLTAAVHFRLMWYFVVVQNELGLDLPSWVQYYKNASKYHSFYYGGWFTTISKFCKNFLE